jgi:nicotinamide mononucleotide (NMN) deamidase PncC
MSVPSFESLQPTQSPVLKDLEALKLKAHRAAYDLLVELNSRATKEKWLQICTTESLTAGLIMATLVDIPWGGYLKYGCFGVYDTDAKRVFNHVTVDDVYTHRCAKEMAIGVLKNSNASIAIAVTGNAMPLNDHADMVGEVFIGIAAYKTVNGKQQIIYSTKSINACKESNIEGFKQICKLWYDTIATEKTYNPRDRTAIMSQEIRNYTTFAALDHCLKFIKINNPEVPDFVWSRKQQNDEKGPEGDHLNIPPSKFEKVIEEVCVDSSCVDTHTPNRVNTKTFTSNNRFSIRARKTRRRKYSR